MKFLYLLLLSALSFTAQSQNIKTSTITWQGTTLVNLSTGEVIEGAHTLTSQSTTRITWTKAGNEPIVFTVSEVNGQWNNVKKDGEVVYEVSSEQERGTITFAKVGTERKIRMVLLKDAGESLISELTVSEFQAY